MLLKPFLSSSPILFLPKIKIGISLCQTVTITCNQIPVSVLMPFKTIFHHVSSQSKLYQLKCNHASPSVSKNVHLQMIFYKINRWPTILDVTFDQASFLFLTFLVTACTLMLYVYGFPSLQYSCPYFQLINCLKSNFTSLNSSSKNI